MRLFAIMALALLPLGTAEPRIENRNEVEYVAIRAVCPMSKLPEVLPKAWKDVSDWLKKKNLSPSGPPILRYLAIDMPNRLDVHVGWPVSKAIKGDGHVMAGTLPAGRYVVLNHVGPYSGMVKANSDLQAWAKSRGIKWEMHGKKMDKWTGRVERYLKDPGNEKDPRKYETEIAYLAEPSGAGGE